MGQVRMQLKEVFVCWLRSTVAHIATTYMRLQKWLLRAVEADALARIRTVYRGREERQKAKERDLTFRIDRYSFAFQSVFDSLVRLLLPQNHRGVISEFRPYRRNSTAILARLQFGDGTLIDNASSRLDQMLTLNPDVQPPERLQEIRCLQHALASCNAPCTLVCPEKFVIRDEFGRFKDDWDGVIFAISDASVRLIVVEGKTGGTIHEREEGAFQQLDTTRKLLHKKFPLSYRRTRIPKLGAMLEIAVA